MCVWCLAGGWPPDATIMMARVARRRRGDRSTGRRLRRACGFKMLWVLLLGVIAVVLVVLGLAVRVVCVLRVALVVRVKRVVLVLVARGNRDPPKPRKN